MVPHRGDEQRTTKKVLLSYSANRHLKLSFAKNFQKGIVLYPSTLFPVFGISFGRTKREAVN